ncbi:MAG: hypothetical protein LBS31_11870 [Candidatus Adiutrix sp.]|jgi:hypothetical protein|nr:hypothetical protein [Candidatus Adiutrix sp.]
MESKQKTRRLLLAPHLWPLLPEETMRAGATCRYLSWPGWELFLERRLKIEDGDRLARPLLLPDVQNPEQDFKTLDELTRKAGEMGSALIFLLDENPPESVVGLAGAISGGRVQRPRRGPILDDRLYLALWTFNEYQTRQGDLLLAGAVARERRMWADLKGEDPPAAGRRNMPPNPAAPDAQSGYAWQCWRRLASGLTGSFDAVAPTAPSAPPI